MQVKVALREAKYFGVLCSASLASLVSSVFVCFLCWPPWSPLMCFGYFVLARFGLLASLGVPWCPQCGLGLGGGLLGSGLVLGLVAPRGQGPLFLKGVAIAGGPPARQEWTSN